MGATTMEQSSFCRKYQDCCHGQETSLLNRGILHENCKDSYPLKFPAIWCVITYNILLLWNFTSVLKFKYASYTFNYASFKQTIATVNRTQPMTTQRHPTHLWDSRRVVTQVTATVSHTVHVIEAPFMLM